MSNRHSRAAFLRTLRSVVDHRGQAVCALDRLRADLPTLIIFGDEDRCIPVAHAHSVHDAIPGSELHVLPGVGHQPQVQCPDIVAQLVSDFAGRRKSAPVRPVCSARRTLRAVPA